ncbi:uncharacterized protein GLRG_02345, partial [Colletotrichum graminicola M1.001]
MAFDIQSVQTDGGPKTRLHLGSDYTDHGETTAAVICGLLSSYTFYYYQMGPKPCGDSSMRTLKGSLCSRLILGRALLCWYLLCWRVKGLLSSFFICLWVLFELHCRLLVRRVKRRQNRVWLFFYQEKQLESQEGTDRSSELNTFRA